MYLPINACRLNFIPAKRCARRKYQAYARPPSCWHEELWRDFVSYPSPGSTYVEPPSRGPQGERGRSPGARSEQRRVRSSFRRGWSHQRVVDQRRGAVRRFVLVGDPRQSLPRLLGFTLPVPHTGIESTSCQKLGVGSTLGNAALIQHDDFVDADDRGQPMRDHQRGAVARNPLQRVLDFLLGMAVERPCGLGEHEDRRPLENGARDRDTLLLAPG